MKENKERRREMKGRWRGKRRGGGRERGVSGRGRKRVKTEEGEGDWETDFCLGGVGVDAGPRLICLLAPFA